MDYQSLYAHTVADLKKLAKDQGIRLPAGAKKNDIVQILLDVDEVRKAQKSAPAKADKPEAAPVPEQPVKADKPEVAPVQEQPAKADKPEAAPVSEKTAAPVKSDESTAAPAEKPVPVRRSMSTQQRMGARTRNDVSIRSQQIRQGAQARNSAVRTQRTPSRPMPVQAQQRDMSKAPRPRPVQGEQEPRPAVPVAAQQRDMSKAPRPRPVQAEQEMCPAAPVPAQPAPEQVMPKDVPVREDPVTAASVEDFADGAGILEIHQDGYGFLRADNYLPGTRDVYVSSTQIRRFNLRTGDYVVGKTRPQQTGDRSVGLIYINSVNGMAPDVSRSRRPFDSLIPVYPDTRLRLERADVKDDSLRMIDMFAPVGKGQRGLIVSQPKAGKTTLLKKIANAITVNNPESHLIVLLIDERPEEVTDMKRSIQGEVVYSTFDEAPENHTRVSEMVLERAQRLVELGKDVVILLDSITRLARAYNLVIPPTGRSLSGGLDPGALYKPKRFFGAARNIENGGSLTIIATALVDTGSRMDDIIYEEFKGTGNMELHLDRSLSDRRIFPAIDMFRSGTRREELLMTSEELECSYSMRRLLSGSGAQEVAEYLIMLMSRTADNAEFCRRVKDYTNSFRKDGFKMK